MTGSGYELDKLVPLLGGALKSTQPLPADPAGADRLARSLKKMTKPSELMPATPVPQIASLVSGKHNALPANVLQLSSVALRFSSIKSTMVIERQGQTFELSIGFDGVARVSQGPIGIPVELSGEWTAPDSSLRLEYEETAGANHFELHLTFSNDGSTAEVEVTDLSRLVPADANQRGGELTHSNGRAPTRTATPAALLFHLCAFHIRVPPVRERREEISKRPQAAGTTGLRVEIALAGGTALSACDPSAAPASCRR
ncbi:MAG TPA: hypothetical protein VMS64_12575 [Candidatus Methylomirabilis sp.]|nr:hypothetical protein [Candidatus Methylomirabilis sp.]